MPNKQGHIHLSKIDLKMFSIETWSGIVHHKSWPQNICHTHSWPQHRLQLLLAMWMINVEIRAGPRISSSDVSWMPVFPWVNIPILPIGILDFCKQTLAAPSLRPMKHLSHRLIPQSRFQSTDLRCQMGHLAGIWKSSDREHQTNSNCLAEIVVYKPVISQVKEKFRRKITELFYIYLILAGILLWIIETEF